MVYFIPTPIGNLDDVTLRSLKLLSVVTTLFCEDTRITKKLLTLLKERHNLQLPTQKYISLHSHNEKKVLDAIDMSIFDKDVAYLSDAGMPCISDPGSYFVSFCQEKNIAYEILPGANAALLAYASSGFANPRFIFYGFLAHKGEERKAGLEEIKNTTIPMILYESPHRIEKLIDELALIIPQRKAVVIKEATKKFDHRFIGTCSQIKEQTQTANLRGEWVIVIDGQTKEAGIPLGQEDILSLSLPPKQKAKLLAKMSGDSVTDWYNRLLVLI